MSNVLGYNILENGIVSALPYLVGWLLDFPISFVCDQMIKNTWVSLITMRKIANSFGQIIPACALIGLGFVTSEYRALAVGILIVALGCNVAVFSGHSMSHVDISPNFSGTLMGITNASANIFGIIAPLMCRVIVTNVENIYQWRRVFLLAAGIYIFDNFVFILYGDARV